MRRTLQVFSDDMGLGHGSPHPGAASEVFDPRELVDSFGRVVTDLRISITDRCNLRCRYCMPEENMEWIQKGYLLSFEEITRVAEILVADVGIRSIRLTGGEPTVRKDLPRLVEMLSSLKAKDPRAKGHQSESEDSSKPSEPVLEDLSMTTNAVLLSSLADRLARAGLDRLNISLDTLDPERFRKLTGRDRFFDVMQGIDAAIEAGFSPIKLNTVAMRGVNDDELADIAVFALERGIEPRFIEFMPLDGDRAWNMDSVISAKEILKAVSSRVPLELGGPEESHDPARRYRVANGEGYVGVIASVTQPFCASCDRIRLSADGQIRNCLFALQEYDLRDLLRSGASREQIKAIFRSAVAAKWAGHSIGSPVFVRPRRAMVQIGG
jgi:cyclic pyranopterin phosphate synthase